MKGTPYSFRIDDAGRVHDTRGEPSSAEGLGKIHVQRGELNWSAAFPKDARDLMRMASAIHLADRLAVRRSADGGSHRARYRWGRRIRLSVELEDSSRWALACDELVELLRFLTDDAWDFSFQRCSWPQGEQRLLFPDRMPSEAEVVLFSGGLDSAAGLQILEATSRAVTVPISIFGNSHRQSYQRRVLGRLGRSHVERRAVGLDTRFRRSHDAGSRVREEVTQRSRGFLFLALAAAVTRTLDLQRFSVFEPGIGALNPSLVEAQVGACNARSVHPATLLRMEKLLTRVLDSGVRIELPYRFSTKGELCARVGAPLAGLAAATISCDRTERAQPIDDLKHCGACTSCLFRRSALHRALPGCDPSDYGGRPTWRRTDYSREAFHLFALRLRQSGCAWRELLRMDPAIGDSIDYWASHGYDPEDAIRETEGLFRRHAEEVLDFYGHPEGNRG